jgi:hypothetical protein
VTLFLHQPQVAKERERGEVESERDGDRDRDRTDTEDRENNSDGLSDRQNGRNGEEREKFSITYFFSFFLGEWRSIYQKGSGGSGGATHGADAANTSGGGAEGSTMSMHISSSSLPLPTISYL